MKPKPIEDDTPTTTAEHEPAAIDFSLHAMTATLPNGKRVRIRHRSWRGCWARAQVLKAVRVVDSAGHVWEREGNAFRSVGVPRRRPAALIIKREKAP